MTAEPTKTAPRATESGHWYDREGNLIEQVLKADGKGYTKPTIVHARKLDLCPGVTTIIKAAAKPDLTLWLQRQAILAALTLPRLDGETEASWLQRVEEDMQSTARKAAEEGTRIHAAVERAITGQDFDPAYSGHVVGVRKALLDNTPPAFAQGWNAERSGVSRLGFATKADLYNEQAGILLDMKGKDGGVDDFADLKLYDEHPMQLWATAQVLPRVERAGIMFVSRTHPGICQIVWCEPEKLERGRRMFLPLLCYWQAKNKHCPTWANKVEVNL